MLVNAVYDINALTITIEVNIRAGTQYYMPGLPDNAVKEGFQACDQCHYGFGFPRMLKQKFVVNLAPADVKKEGSSYDLSIGILAA
jgi:magnesium chelatase family protein